MERGGRYEELSWSPDFARTRGSKSASGTYRAFIPSEIADEDFGLSGSSAELAERAAAAVRGLNSGQSALVPLEGLARQLLRSEALASSQIEGLSISHKKLAEAELTGRQGHHKAKEIMANVQAMERAMRIGVDTARISVDDIREIHAEMAIVPPLDKIAGQIREEASWIGGAAPPDAEYVGPPYEYVRPLLEDLCLFMDRDDLPVIQQAAIAHAQFELIHPFGDGNGRVGRCLIHVLFGRRGIAPSYVPPVSLVLGANKDAYIAGIERFRDEKVNVWVDQFSRSVEVAANKAAEFSADVLACQADWRMRLGDARSDSAVFPIIDILPKYPIITAAVAETEIGRSRPAAINALERLANENILTRHRNQKKGDSWEAKELFALLSEFEAAVKLPGF
jgi:Fic family protein